jgi:hypothetical protein
MTNQSTKSKFAEILAQAQAKAEAQANGTKVTNAPKKVTKVAVAPVQVPAQPKPIPTTTMRVVTKDNLIQRYRSFSVPELSTTTIDDIVGEVKPKVMSIRIVHYSDKCVAVMGDTKPHKDSLKAIGGKFNPWLKGGEGWVFPKWKEAEIRSAFSL